MNILSSQSYRTSSMDLGNRYAARFCVKITLLSRGNRYAARLMVVVRVLSRGNRYAARLMVVVRGAIER